MIAKRDLKKRKNGINNVIHLNDYSTAKGKQRKKIANMMSMLIEDQIIFICVFDI